MNAAVDSGALGVLLIEDNPGDALLLSEALGPELNERFAIRHVETLADAKQALDEQCFDVILLDLSLPDAFGLETLDRVREWEWKSPVVVLTGNANEAVAMEALKRGAEDYLTKDRVDGAVVSRSIRYAIERHQNTKRIRELNTELRAELDRRLEELREAQSTAIQAERLAALGTLAGGVAHELNNPLMGVINYIQYALKKTEGQAAAGAALGEALKYARRCAEIVKDLLSFSRQGTMMHMLEGMSGDANDAMREAVHDAKATIDETKVNVRFELDPELPGVTLDESRLRQVLLNLIRNACHAMEESEERTLVCRSVAGERDVTLMVADTGSGMDEATQARIFEMFFTTKAQGKGTGIGLALCRRLVEGVGGSISVESERGKGTVFAVKLPAALRPSDAQANDSERVDS